MCRLQLLSLSGGDIYLLRRSPRGGRQRRLIAEWLDDQLFVDASRVAKLAQVCFWWRMTAWQAGFWVAGELFSGGSTAILW